MSRHLFLLGYSLPLLCAQAPFLLEIVCPREIKMGFNFLPILRDGRVKTNRENVNISSAERGKHIILEHLVTNNFRKSDSAMERGKLDCKLADTLCRRTL